MDWYTPMPSKVFQPGSTDNKSYDVENVPVVSVEQMRFSAGVVTPPPEQTGYWGGDKYYGGFGATQIFTADYYTLRARSAQLFTENLYARGIIRRMVTNEINTGLTLECIPDGDILGIDDETLADWAENVENRFTIWTKNPKLCDFEERRTFGELQRQMRIESLICGDVLVILDISRINGLPKVRLINGSNVQTPMDQTSLSEGHKIEHGVELDAMGKHVAYYVVQADNTFKRIPAWGPRSKRRVAWLVYGSDKRMDDVRGEPFLSLFMQSLKEIDRYRDSAQRKASINSVIAGFIKKTENKPGTMPLTGGAVRKGTVDVQDDTNSVRQFKMGQYIPGLYMEELQTGEEPVPYSTSGTDVNFGPFEDAIVNTMAWSAEAPPEIIKLSFTNNYSASAAAINEYKMYLNFKRMGIGETFTHPIYVEWFISENLTKKIIANGFLQSWRDPRQYDIYGAWIASDWTGAIKPSTDLVKQAKGYQMMVSEGWITNERAARELTGTKFRKNMKRIKRENELKVEAAKVLLELEQVLGPERAQAILHGGLLGISAEDCMIKEEIT